MTIQLINYYLKNLSFLIYRMSSTTDLLSKLFNDPKTGFVGADKLLRRAKQYNPKITLAQVKEFLKDNSIHQVFQKPTKEITDPRIHGKIIPLSKSF
jgi:hypothetical protein